MSQRELLEAVRQLNPSEFQHFVTDVLDLRAARQAPRVSVAEADLLVRINTNLPDKLQCRLGELHDKRDAETLTADEHAELLQFTEQIERLEADRLDAMTQLADLRHITLSDIADQLGIRAKAHA